MIHRLKNEIGFWRIVLLNLIPSYYWSNWNFYRRESIFTLVQCLITSKKSIEKSLWLSTRKEVRGSQFSLEYIEVAYESQWTVRLKIRSLLLIQVVWHQWHLLPRLLRPDIFRMNLWSHPFSKLATQKFKGFLTQKFFEA